MEKPRQYWLSGFGLSRQVVLSQIQYFLGPGSSVRPYTYQGREGYLIMGTWLTTAQIKDLKDMSREYEIEASVRMKHNASPVNDSSDTESAIHEPIPVCPSDRGRKGARDQDRGHRQQQSSLERMSRTNRSW